ncbi:MAG: transcription elongation factor GreA [Deltaproteobacteria bacterium RIFCSPLOWO2_12_FULL_40_28]|nr:MAG: transcription elongation factor GreA [Deltaproteobacteria bacterium RIFCSPHIGHO2_02_FULL_40_28]OGQ20830.1 MAG: transcription elongation factor GreA [Deltaproteobacteria bacterium RIFCSPHIGHO2_12_FULL_40_32]OGQ39231.1 MAG: transcription elongation factor GreA [Deltaproteobacteria bacterium RIFCSPLOWO2_02_FULL_40_36]OGQ54512.1 MAG: transcription elongation factor GreA [Deltaproteobacteria bacterium RIFCSPLOWO2_12_FULL_40_28]
MIERFPFTPEGIEKVKKELSFLKAIDRPRIVDELETARAHGDLSENAEYHAAKEKLGHVMGRIEYLENVVSKAEIIDPKSMKGSAKVMFGAIVKLLDLDDDSQVTYQIVGELESDVGKGKVSVKSPIARSLIGKFKEDTVIVKAPKGKKEYEIIEVIYE